MDGKWKVICSTSLSASKVSAALNGLCCCAAGVWRRSVSTAVWAVWRSLMSASPGRSRFLAGVSLRRWSGRWGRRRGNCLRTEQPSPVPLSFRPSWDQPPSSPCSSTSAYCSRGCPSEEVGILVCVTLWFTAHMLPIIEQSVLPFVTSTQLHCDVGWLAKCHIGNKRMVFSWVKVVLCNCLSDIEDGKWWFSLPVGADLKSGCSTLCVCVCVWERVLLKLWGPKSVYTVTNNSLSGWRC